MQKVITVNIDPFEIEKSKGYKETELEVINSYLQQGWLVKDKFSTVPNGTNAHCVNITFILYK